MPSVAAIRRGTDVGARDVNQLLSPHRLFEVVVGPALHRFNGGANGAEGSDDDKRGAGTRAPQAAEKIQSGAVRQAEVAHHELKRVAIQCDLRRGDRRGGLHTKPIQAQRCGERQETGRVVIDEQNLWGNHRRTRRRAVWFLYG